MNGLNPEQISFFQENGYLLVENVLSPTDFQPLIRDLEQIIDQKVRAVRAEGRLSELFENEPFERRLVRICEAMEDPVDIQQLIHGKLKTEGMFQVLTHPAILDIVESLIGPEILAHPQFNIRSKFPHQDEGVVPWHQDLGYLQPDAEETFMVNFWIPLVHATAENGCMEVIAGSHKSELIAHKEKLGPGRNFKGIIEAELPPGAQVLCPVRVGSVLLTQHKTIHRSIPNHSDHIRWSLDLRYSDPASPTGRDNVPGFIARSQARPESVSCNLQDWLKVMEAAQAA